MTDVEAAGTNASRFLETCLGAVELQHQRAKLIGETTQDAMEWQVLEPDCYLLVLALQQAIVAVEAVARFEERQNRRQIRQVVDAFNVVHEDLKDLRDILTHFDAYLRGAGKKQNGDSANTEFFTHRKWRMGEDEQLLLWIRVWLGDDSGMRRVEALGAARDIVDLIHQVRTVIPRRAGEPRGKTRVPTNDQ